MTYGPLANSYSQAWGESNKNRNFVENRKLLNTIPWRYIFNYFRTRESLFRHYQNLFLDQYGKELTGVIIELGGEKNKHHERYFPYAASYICANIARDYDQYLDLTQMPFEDCSQEAYVCVSTLEHVYDIQKAFSEIERTLKVGGKILLVVPFAFARHDDADYWRLAEDSFNLLLRHYEIKAFVHFGGTLSTITAALQRPKGEVNLRYFVYKAFGMVFAILAKYFDALDGLPIAYGIFAIKKL